MSSDRRVFAYRTKNIENFYVDLSAVGVEKL